MAGMGDRIQAQKASGEAILRRRRPIYRLQGELRPTGQQSSSHQVQISQREQSKGAHGVLSQAAVTNHSEAPQSLDHMKGVLATGATARSCPIDRALIL